MAALSSAESPPPVFNGDATEREPGRPSGVEELGPGLDSSCTSGIPGGPQEEEETPAGKQTEGDRGRRRGLQRVVRDDEPNFNDAF
ncbi:hypothetical protein XENOCAPTIV_009987 [Xenoophorus captivus]|uniref:Uncharacterized protein n=1 Tax=Xenoophorus captivus TaxID=1517983 RepID=A0ABV0RRB4_9TELE